MAIADSTRQPVEYVRYSSYGEGVAYPVVDVNMDGVVNTTDQSVWNSGSPTGAYAYGADNDLNRDGAENASDTTFFNASYTANTSTSGKGRMSSLSVANRKGYAGYEFDEAARVYHVRHRVYLPESGRWSRRDPLGYVDGMSLYEVARSCVILLLDPSGLACESANTCNPEDAPGDLLVCGTWKEKGKEKSKCVMVPPGQCSNELGVTDGDIFFVPGRGWFRCTCTAFPPEDCDPDWWKDKDNDLGDDEIRPWNPKDTNYIPLDNIPNCLFGCDGTTPIRQYIPDVLTHCPSACEGYADSTSDGDWCGNWTSCMQDCLQSAMKPTITIPPCPKQIMSYSATITSTEHQN